MRTWKPATGMIFFSGALFFLLVGNSPYRARERSVDSAPDRASCEKLYAHQLLLFKTEENPIATAIKLNNRNLSSPRSREAQIEWCLTRETRRGYQCQMKARTLRELLLCRSERGGSRKAGDEKGPGKSSGAEEKGSSAAAEKKNGNESRISVIKDGAKSSVAVTAKRCKMAYDHLLRIYSESKSFQKRPDAERLLRHWKSPAARNSFELRCRRVFRGEDLNCILSTTDTVIIQGCLFRVPPPEGR